MDLAFGLGPMTVMASNNALCQFFRPAFLGPGPHFVRCLGIPINMIDFKPLRRTTVNTWSVLCKPSGTSFL